MSFILGIIIGLVVGGSAGVLLAGLLFAAYRDQDESLHTQP